MNTNHDALRELPLTELSSRLRTSPSLLAAYVSETLDRVEAMEPTINALIPETERRERLAAEIDALLHRAASTDSLPLFGVLVGVKDIFKIDQLPMQAGSRLPSTAFTEQPSVVVEQLHRSGALILGRTVSTEFAYFEPGPTRNPLNTAHTPGGSSSGSAAAVAAEYCRVALGTQTIGSIGRPAAFCGIVGFKPSYDALSREGVFPFSQSADHVGLLTASVADAQTVFGALANSAAQKIEITEVSNKNAATVTGSAARSTFLIPHEDYLSTASHKARKDFDLVVDKIVHGGARIVTNDALAEIAAITIDHKRMIAHEFARNHRDLIARYGDLYSEKSRQLVASGQDIGEDEYRAAVEGRTVLRDHLDAELANIGAQAWLSPASVTTAPAGIASTGDPAMNLPWTYAGLPTVVIPSGTTPDGLPYGLQIAGAFAADRSVLGVAEALAPIVSTAAQ